LWARTVGQVIKIGFIRNLYNWVLHWSESKYGTVALFLVAFIESSVFPVPPDVLLIALALGAPTKSFRFALVCTIGSVFGGMLGYLIGSVFFNVIGIKILEFYGFMDNFQQAKELYAKYDVWIVAIAGFTPIPYKVFTIASGVFDMDFFKFVIISFFSRGARFYIVAGLIWKFGPTIKKFIDKYLDFLSILFVVLLILGFILIKYVF
jgi:membrane protein YqaA with SNARE-associated domain